MHMNMYLFFKNLNILCIFNDRFFDPVFFRFRLFGVDRFNDRFGSGNIDIIRHRKSPNRPFNNQRVRQLCKAST
jgi:hypothetical protein